ncbi:phosphoribosyltransferase family protein [Arthrobacter sp. AL12]|uniref:phosphoribosyltransferase n=1 Tax=Arthrobacter sp. AL12 TaxID=3042241 RepID=UPI00249C1E2A|nr:phosphoribosyltransferase family protein [Arthrobacter sp. AL12]MDI3212967.1 phosphoribosyltransferase family protein [Arthrobacter sp. AL12]
MGMRFTDRGQGGRLLAAALPQFRGRPDTVVLGLARGGVPVAAEAAAALRLDRDVLPVRKLGIPGHGETAFGALAAVNGRVAQVLNRPYVGQLLELGITQSALDEVVRFEQKELERRAETYPGPRLPLAGRTVIVVDDGMATGATMRAAVKAVQAAGAATVVVGVPVASLEAQASLQQIADAVFSLFIPGQFRAVGSYYRSFGQVRDDDVVRLLGARPA